MRRLIAFTIMVLTLLSVVLLSWNSIESSMNPGIEFKGGFEILYQISPKAGSTTPIEDLVASAAETIIRRVDIAGVKNPQVTIEDNNTIRVTVALSGSSASVQELIESDADITFRDVNDQNLVSEGVQLLEEGGAILDYQDGKPVVSLRIANTDEFARITSEISRQTAPNNRIIIWLGFNPETDSYQASQQDATIARKIISNASVNETITSASAVISGSFSADQATRLADLIRAGTIDFELERLSVNTIGASYGQQAYEASIFAGIIGLLAVSVFMVLFYGIAGVASSITLLVYVAITLTLFNLMKGEYGPDTIAATVISIGMAVDAHIISFERIKDELYKGRNLTKAFEEGNKKSFSSILDANLTTLIAAFVLYIFGTRTVKGFATMLVISIFFTLVIIVYLAQFLVSIVAKSEFMQKHPGWFAVKVKDIPNVEKGESTKHQGFFAKTLFMKSAKFWIGLSTTIISAGAVAMIIFSLLGQNFFNLGLQFSEGTRILIETNRPEYAESAGGRELIENFFQDTEGLGVETSQIIFGTTEDEFTLESYTTISIRFKTYLTNDQITLVETTFKDLNDDNADLFFKPTIVTVTPVVAQQTVLNALWAVLFASIGIVIYTALRFTFNYAVAALIALVHDVLITVALFALFRFEVNVEFVSAILAIIGYSINDTIVAFDRLRENIAETRQKTLTHQNRIDLVNLSLQQTVGRSIMTTLTTLFTVIALLIFGSSSSFFFNLAMVFGLTAGTYSSIYIAPIIWIWLEDMGTNRKAKVKPAKTRKNSGPEEHIFIGLND